MVLTLMKEETLSSFLIRSLYVSGTLNLNRVAEPLFSKTSKEWFLFPLANREFVGVYKKLFENLSLEEVIRNHTLAPIYKPTSRYLDYYLARRFMTVSSTFTVLAVRGRGELFNKIEIISTMTKFCPLCFSEQVNEFGFTWFKREWQIHLMGECLKHGCSLLFICSCGKKPTKINEIIALMQGRCEHCDSDPWVNKNTETRNEYPRWLTNLLNADLKPFSFELRRFLILEAAARLQTQKPKDWDIPKFLGRLYEPFYEDDSRKQRDKRNAWQTANRNYIDQIRKALTEPQKIPFTILFHPLSLAFPMFDDFLSFLNEVSYSTIEKYYPHTPILDLKHNLHLTRERRLGYG